MSCRTYNTSNFVRFYGPVFYRGHFSSLFVVCSNRPETDIVFVYSICEFLIRNYGAGACRSTCVLRPYCPHHTSVRTLLSHISSKALAFFNFDLFYSFLCFHIIFCTLLSLLWLTFFSLQYFVSILLLNVHFPYLGSTSNTTAGASSKLMIVHIRH